MNYAYGAFTTIINAPPAAIEDLLSIGSDTQLNLYAGASTRYLFRLGGGFEPSSNIEVNLHGGTVGEFFTTSSGFSETSEVVVNIHSGKVGRFFEANAGSVVNIFGGEISSFFRARAASSISPGVLLETSR